MPRDRRGVVALVLVVVVAAAVLAVVLLVGIRRVPDYPTVAERRDPAVEGAIAYLQPPDDRSRPCVVVVAASGGAATEVYCPADGEEPGLMQWNDDGTLTLGLYVPFETDTAVRIDPRTGRSERISLNWESAFAYPPDVVSEPRASDGARLATDAWDEDDTTAWLDIQTGGDARRLVSARGPRGYGFLDPQWSPDGRWVLFRDTEERLLIVRDDERAEVRVVAHRAWSPVVTEMNIEPVPAAGS